MTKNKNDIAIIGMNCLLPGADSITGFWASIKEGRDSIGDIPSTHWSVEDYYDPNPKAVDKTYGRRGGFLSHIKFEPLKYGIPPSDLSAIDTTQLLGLVAADRALAHAGYGANKNYDHSRTAVMLGVTGALKLVVTLGARLAHPQLRKALTDSGVDSGTIEEVLKRFGAEFAPWQENSFPGLLGNVTAGRIANRLNLGGGNFVVDAACASSLAAISQGVMSLQSGHTDLVVSGGVDTFSDHFMYTCFSKTPALSPSGDVRPYDQSGDGTILGEGIGIVILKRLADAERDGDHIFSVIKGMGSSSDGKGTAIFAPAAEGQSRAINNALSNAGISADTIELVEGHGTGTAVGDAVEVNALTQVFTKSPSRGKQGPWCALGSVKAQIGHTKAAAGVSGLIKAALALYYKVLPPSSKIKEPLTEILAPESPFYISSYPRPWLACSQHPRRAGVSAFGFGGSNFHCIMEEYSPLKAKPENKHDLEIYAFSGSSPQQIAAALQQAIEIPCTEHKPMAFHSRALFKSSDALRLVIVAQTSRFSSLASEALALLNNSVTDEKFMPHGVFYGEGACELDRYGFLIPGADAAYQQMFRQLACDWPQMLEALNKAEAEIKSGASSLNFSLYPPDLSSRENLNTWNDGFQLIKQKAAEAVNQGLKDILSVFGIKSDDSIDFLHESKANELKSEMEAKPDIKLWLEVGPGSGLSAIIKESYAPVRALALDNNNGGTLDLACFIGRLAAWGLPVDLRPWPFEEEQELEDAEKSFTVSICGANHFVKQDIPPSAQKTNQARAAAIDMNSGQAAHSAINAIERMAAEAARLHQEFLSSHSEALRLMSGSLPGSAAPAPIVPEAKQVAPISTAGAQQDGGNVYTKAAMPLPHAHSSQEEAADYSATIMQIVARETGYPIEMLQPQMNLESDLGLDSIKKVEILAAVSEEIPGVQELSSDIMNSVSTLGELINMSGGFKQPHQPEDVAVAAPPLESSSHDGNWETIKTVVSMETGYPTEMLSLEMSLTDDLGLDSIKLVEIVSSINEKIPHIGTLASETINEAKTLGDLAKAFGSSIKSTTAAKIAAEDSSGHQPLHEVSKTSHYDGSPVDELIKTVLASETGYPVDMLHMNMNLELDLGLDSIKKVEFMAALSEQMPAAQELSTASVMAEIQTLGDLSRILAPQASLINNVPHADMRQPQQASSPDNKSMEALLLETVSQETGYPTDILSLNADLEADLGLDSIKRVEIMSALNELLPADTPFNSASAEALNSARTLGDLLNMLQGNSVIQPSPCPAAAALSDLIKEETPAAPPRRKPGRPPKNTPLVDIFKENTVPDTSGASVSYWRLVSGSLPGYSGSLPQLPATGSDLWLLADTSALSSSLAELFSNRGVNVKQYGWNDSGLLNDHSLPDSLIMIWPQGATDLSLAVTAFDVLRMAGKGISKAASEGRKPLLMSMTFMGGSFGLGDGQIQLQQSASACLSGLMKTAAREWNGAVVRALDLPQNAYDAEAQTYLSSILESTAADFPVEVGITQGQNFNTPLMKPYRLKNIRVRHLRERQTIIVTGGARGVTAAALKEFAKSNKPHLVILSRTPLPPDEPHWLKDLNEKEIKEALFQKSDQKPSPKELSRQCETILRGREIKENLAALEKSGAQVTYISGEMSDEKYLTSVLKEIKNKYGPVHGFIHGAGVLADSLIADKKTEDFIKVFNTKALMASIIMGQLSDEPLSLLVFFSSSTARFGRKGQADYAAGNEVLNKMAIEAQSLYKGIKCLSINWGPWNGGMVNSSLASLFENEGIGLIPLHEGAKLFATLIGSPKSDPVEIVVLGPDTDLSGMPIKM